MLICKCGVLVTVPPHAVGYKYIDVAQTGKNFPAMREIQVRSLGREDPLEKGTATQFSILAWKIPWTEEHCKLQSMGLQRVRHDLRD